MSGSFPRRAGAGFLPCGHPTATRICNEDREDNGECAWCVDRNELRTLMEQQTLRAEAAEIEVEELRADLQRKDAALRLLHRVHDAITLKQENRQLRGDLARKEAALRALVDDLDLRAEAHAYLHGKSEVVVPVSGRILANARDALGGGSNG
jgi:hypothetical protein